MQGPGSRALCFETNDCILGKASCAGGRRAVAGSPLPSISIAPPSDVVRQVSVMMLNSTRLKRELSGTPPPSPGARAKRDKSPGSEHIPSQAHRPRLVRARKESPGSKHIPRLARPVRLCSAAEQPRFDVGASNRAPTCLLSYPSETARNLGSTQDTIQNPGQGEHGTVRLSSLATQNTPKRSWFKNNAVSDGFENACRRAALGPRGPPTKKESA